MMYACNSLKRLVWESTSIALCRDFIKKRNEVTMQGN